MLCLQCVVVEESSGELFCNSLDWFPVCRAEIRAKCEAALQEQYCVDHKGEGNHDVGVVLELLET